MKKKIKEVIVVEGKDDISAVKNAVDAEVFQVNGHAVRKNKSIEILKLAYENKGLIILTDPDYAGEEIRKYLCKHFPNAKNAYISRVSGTKDGDIGVENASPEDIITALEKARFSLDNSENIASSLDEVRNMRLLTTNLLNLARRDDGIKPEIETLEPAFFDTVFTNYAMIAEENEKGFTAQNQVGRPIQTDKTLLKQLMTILFDNAIKYTEEDGEIDFMISATDRNLYLLVSDNGVGISAEDKKKIFDRFYRVDKARTRQKGGFGLGLSLAKQIVDALKGTITVKDNKPKGTIFEVKIAIHTPSKKKK